MTGSLDGAERTGLGLGWQSQEQHVLRYDYLYEMEERDLALLLLFDWAGS